MAKRTRRTPEQMIEDLQAEIERVKARAARAKVKKDPALKHIAAAVRSIDKAAGASEDKAIRTALGEARATLAACLELAGAAPSAGPSTEQPRGPRVEPESVAAYLADNPGSSAADIAEALGTDTKTLRPVIKGLFVTKRMTSEGKARGTRYTMVEGLLALPRSSPL